VIRVHRIVCPLDFSDCSTRALTGSLELDAYDEAGITALHVYTLALVVRRAPFGLGGGPPDHREAFPGRRRYSPPPAA
jgi:hypothetical protein